MWPNIFGGSKKPEKHTPDQMQTHLADGKAVMLDVRGQSEWDAGHLQDAIFIPYKQISSLPQAAQSVDGLPKDKIIYCH
jgi:predicted sulfurtransferase